MMKSTIDVALVSSATSVAVFVVYAMTHTVAPAILPANDAERSDSLSAPVLPGSRQGNEASGTNRLFRGSTVRVTSGGAAGSLVPTGELLIGYDTERGEIDPWYRRRITRHLARRFVKQNPAFQTEEGRALVAVLESQGLSFERDWETAAQAYEDLLEYHGLRAIADWHLEEERTGQHHPPSDPEIAASERRYRKVIQEVSDRDQRFFKKMATERMQRNTGITDPVFYDTLFRIHPSVGLGPINIAIADDEVID